MAKKVKQDRRKREHSSEKRDKRIELKVRKVRLKETFEAVPELQNERKYEHV